MNVLVVAGEPSGDRTLAAIVREMKGIRAFGVGGDALADLGVELLAHVRDVSAMGLVEVIGRAPAIARAVASVIDRVRRDPPDVAVLASWSAANARIGGWLRRRGVRVVWVSPPEVWAWGASRARSLARCADRMLVTLPFEESIWRRAGADATYVGHPALDVARPTRSEARARCEIPENSRAIALLPGSRPAEILRLLPIFVHAARRLELDARIFVAPSLAAGARARLASLARDVRLLDVPADAGASSLLPAFDAALVASGTASLECALAGVPPVVAYRMHPITAAVAKRVVQIDRVALPNVVLSRAGGAPLFVERLQDDATPESLAAAVRESIENSRMKSACEDVVRAMRAPLADDQTFARRAAARILGTRDALA